MEGDMLLEFCFAQMLRRKKSTDVTQKDLCNICENKSV